MLLLVSLSSTSEIDILILIPLPNGYSKIPVFQLSFICSIIIWFCSNSKKQNLFSSLSYFIVNPKLRRKYKIISTITAIAMVTTSLIINNTFLQNSFIFTLIVQSFVISPQVYKLFKLPYDNYKNYQMAETN